jgi:cytochrome c biogenesis protein CcmG/thiol:disulfide interchange protein DsbE
MKLSFLLPVLILAALAGLLLFGLNNDPREVPSPLIGKAAPAFELARLDQSGPLTLEDLRGRPLLVNFWASWCAGCQVEHPFLMELSRRGIEIVGLDYKDTDAAGLAWLARHGNPYRIIAADPVGQAGLDWGVYGVPETFVLDAQGVIIYKHIGPLTDAAWRERIAPLLAGAAS